MIIYMKKKKHRGKLFFLLRTLSNYLLVLEIDTKTVKDDRL